MKKYIDYKVTQWNRIYLDDNVDLEEIINKLKNNEHEIDNVESNYCEHGVDTSQYLTVVENEGEPTIEVYKNDSLIWDNSLDKEIE